MPRVNVSPFHFWRIQDNTVSNGAAILFPSIICTYTRSILSADKERRIAVQQLFSPVIMTEFVRYSVARIPCFVLSVLSMLSSISAVQLPAQHRPPETTPPPPPQQPSTAAPPIVPTSSSPAAPSKQHQSEMSRRKQRNPKPFFNASEEEEEVDEAGEEEDKKDPNSMEEMPEESGEDTAHPIAESR